MRTMIITLIGLGLWAASLLVARRMSAGKIEVMREATIGFVTVWFMAALTNLWVGITRAGYTLAAELPVFAVIFGVPALAAMLVRWKYFD
jgi:hypothetical protein